MNDDMNMNGFTLIELLVVLVMLSVVVSIGLLVLNITRTNFLKLGTKNSELVDIQNSDMRLTSFFFYSDTLFFDKENKNISSGGGNMFKIKDGSIIDVKNEVLLFDSISGIKIYVYRNQNDKLILCGLFFQKIVDSKLFPFSFKKEYDISTRLNYSFTDSILVQ